MKTWKDPFPPTPEGFHMRVEQTLGELEERKMKHSFSQKKALILVAAIIVALAAVTAVAAVTGGARLRDWLNKEDLGEVAELVQEAHLGDVDAEGFGFTVDELLWEDDDLYVSYALTVPDDGNYLVALYTPTLNGERLVYDTKGFTAPKFFDGEEAALLLLDGRHKNTCAELLTFAVDPRLKQNPGNRLRFSAVLFRTNLEIDGYGDWTDMMDPPRYILLTDISTAVLGEDALTLDELISTGYAEYVAEREIDMGLDGTKLDADVLYNDVAEHDFDRLGLHVHIDRFRMTHLGVEIECTVTGKQLETSVQSDWRFCDPEGKPLGPSLGGEGGGSRIVLGNGGTAWHFIWREDVLMLLNEIDQIAFAPCEYVDDPDGGNHPVFDMENAIILTPVYDEDTAEASPAPSIEPGELDLSR